MAESGDLIDFSTIETQKENIQALPGGRSAKQLSLLCSPVASGKPTPLSQTQELKDRIRADFEAELRGADDADDPLDAYDRYVKWTLDAYPSAQATRESGLPRLLERATKAFLSSAMYRNDPRYLKLWLLYIRLFAEDAPRETYAFLARHGVGDGLALFYEEYAAWLEAAGRWRQADEVFASGVQREARPRERLLRKYAEFQRRRSACGDAGGDSVGPDDGAAMPALRPALAHKTDPFGAGAAEGAADPQAQVAATPAAAAKPRPGRKLAVFADGEAPAEAAPSSQGWDTIGSLAERKKENRREPTPWAGETLEGGRKAGAGEPKMAVFRDPSLKLNLGASSHPFLVSRNVTVNPASGKRECVFADLESMYPDGPDGEGEEFSFEELRARHRGLLGRNWSQVEPSPLLVEKAAEPEPTCHLDLPLQDEASQVPVGQRIKLNDQAEDKPTEQNRNALKSARQDEKANRTRKIHVMEVRAETQTIQINLDSPAGPKIRRRKTAEPTVTIHTKAAMDEVYDIFNQTLNITPVAEEDATEEADDDSDDDATSMGDSTGTGHMSTTMSECGDETGDFTASSKADPDATTRHTIDSEYSDVTNAVDADTEEDISVVNIDVRDLDTRDPEVDSLPADDFEDIAEPQSDEEYDFVDQPADPVSYRAKGMNRLPFMTPIVEKTESSIGAVTAAGARTHMSMKTPSRIPRDAVQEDDTPMSSPFQELEIKNEIRVRIPQPDLPKPNPNVALGAASIAGNSIKGKPNKGPIILDAQCNPMDLALRQNILTQIHPPIATYGGFYASLGSNAHKSSEIRRFVKSQTKGPLAPAPCLEFSGSKRTYTVRRELGRGAYAPVYLVDSTPKDEEEDRNFGPQRDAQEVIKMEDPPTPWEFYMIRQAKRRLGSSRPAESIVEAHEMHLFDDEGFLVEEFRNQGTLLEAINACRGDGSTGGHMDELLVLFFSIEVFRTVEALHAKGLIHGDLKADNILLRLDSGAGPDASWAARYRADGRDGWSERGVVLIDFGRGIDMRQFRPDVQFVADWKTTDADCPEMREMRPWTFQADYHGLAGVVHCMLFGKYMETRAERAPGLGAGATKTYAVKEGLKRYWQTGIWTEVFELLLNPTRHLEGEEGGRLPVIQGLRRARGLMEEYLEANGEKGQGLKPLLRRLEGSIRERRK